MFDWIPAFFERATAWCPRLVKVPPTHRLVKWSLCQTATLHGPGLIFYWPLVTEVELHDIRAVSTVMYVQSMTLIDGTSVSARGKVVWQPGDLIHAVNVNSDYNDRVAEILLTCIVEFLPTHQRHDLHDVATINEQLTGIVTEKMVKLGIDVEEVSFIELVISPAFRIVNDHGE